jgi:sugar/nucleoside kinase (ribokinase family)
MELVDYGHIQNVLNRTASQPEIVTGGSACNTAVGVGKLGGRACFVGKCGQDDMGERYAGDLKQCRVEPLLFTSSTPTGQVLSIITPDAQRSLLTYLGAASEMSPEEMTPRCFKDAAIVHVEGYLLFNPDLMAAVLNAAKKAGALISLDLASFTVVEANKARVLEIAEDYVDILIANEDEARAFTGEADEQRAIKALAAKAPLAVLKVGPRGSFIAHAGQIIPVAPIKGGRAVDTTGAGDLWAAGFLYGLVNGLPLETCGALGSACGFEVCQVVGATIPEAGWGRINNMFQYAL